MNNCAELFCKENKKNDKRNTSSFNQEMLYNYEMDFCIAFLSKLKHYKKS